MPNILRVSCIFRYLPTGIYNIVVEADAPQKIIRNGHLLIIHNGKTYNALGAEVR